MNPYFAYSLAFSVALTIYSLGWSKIYPPLSLSLFFFIAITIVAFAGVGVYWKKTIQAPKISLPVDRRAIFITLFIYVLWTIEFFNEGGVPLIKILTNAPYDYRYFGVPSLHVFVVTFSSFYTIYLFHVYSSTRRRGILALYAINLFAAFLIYNRGMFLFNVVASAFVALSFAHRIPKKLLLVSPFVLVIAFYLFGVFGNIRVSHIEGTSYNGEIFLNTGGANDRFRNGPIPDEFFWMYIYTSSPLANLQENINKADRHCLQWSWFFKMVNNEMLPDFISKRINRWFKIPHPGDYRIERYFNVSTVYSIAFSHLCWNGMVIMVIFILAIPFLYFRILRLNSPYTLTALAILSTMYLFMAYDNTIRFTGLSFQLFYPVAFHWLEQKNWFNLRAPN